MKSMDASELVKQPQDVTENPYKRSGKDKLLRGNTALDPAEVCVGGRLMRSGFVFMNKSIVNQVRNTLVASLRGYH